MVQRFPVSKARDANADAVRMRMDLTFDLPPEMAEQLDLWGINYFELCEYDPSQRHIKLSASTTLYRKGGAAI